MFRIGLSRDHKKRADGKQVETKIQTTLKHIRARKLTEDKITQGLHLFISLSTEFIHFHLLFCYPSKYYLFKFDSRNTRTKFVRSLKFRVTTPERT